MKKYLYIWFVLLVAFGCNKDDDYTKPGVSLPTVNNLSIQPADSNKVRLTWNIPANLPTEIAQPLSVNVEVTEILGPTRSISVFSTLLANAPGEYTYTLPVSTTPKTYHFIVKLFGSTKTVDRNYSNSIYSLGQTVVYTK